MMQKQIKKPAISVLLGFVIRFIPAFLLVSSLFYVAGSLYARMLLPLFAFEIEAVHPGYEIRSYGLESLPKGDEIFFVVKINRPIVDKFGIPRYGKETKLETVASVLYIQPIIVFSLLFSWPALSFRERLKAALISVPFLIAIISIDIPVFAVGRIEMSFPVDSLSGQIRIMLNHFFSNGGRQFLALLVVLVTIGLVRVMRPFLAESDLGPNDPCPCGSGKKYKRCCM